VTIEYNAFQRSIPGVFQYVEVCGCVWQCVAVRHSGCVAVCCSVLHCIALRYSVLQCVAVCSSVAFRVCCSVLHPRIQEGLDEFENFYAVTHSLELKKGLTNLKKSHATTHSRAGYETLRCRFYLKY